VLYLGKKLAFSIPVRRMLLLARTLQPRSSNYPMLRCSFRAEGVVDIRQHAMLSVLAPEDDGATTTDLHLRAIAELQ
jgi:hypothetical protein